MSEFRQSLMATFSAQENIPWIFKQVLQLQVSTQQRGEKDNGNNNINGRNWKLALAALASIVYSHSPVDTCPLALLNKFQFDGPLGTNSYHSHVPATGK